MQDSNDCPMIVRHTGPNGFVRVNTAFRQEAGFDNAELADKPLLDWIDSSDHATVRATLESGEGRCHASHRTRCGGLLPLEIKVSGQGDIVVGRCSATARHTAFEEDNVDEATVSGTLHTIARIVEAQLPGYKCSILLVADGRFVRGAGPSLPDDYNAAVDGYAIGPTVGSCGTAIYWNVPVIVEDIQTDPLWADLAELAEGAGVAACWSHPFTSRNGKVLGALALYAPAPQSPTDEQLSILQAAARMTGLAVERGRAEEALREHYKRELELENQLRQAAKMEALGVLAGGVAHDFNNVLATILANAELAQEVSPADSELRKMLSEIVAASQRAGNFCQQMLAYSGGGKVRTSQFELGALVPQLSSLVQAALSKKADLVYRLHEKPIYLEGDENQLLQVIMNLVINAADALGNDEGHIEVGTELAHYDAESLRHIAPGDELPAGEYVRLTVRDDGCGIDASQLDRIFDPFFTTKTTGRGLGLAAVKGIVVSHRGAIQIESERGKGTTFEVLLPTIAPPESSETAAESSRHLKSRKRILVVDDDENLRAIICKWLERGEFDVVEASDGQQAIIEFRQDPGSFDCVLLDLSMPKFSGDEVHQAMKSLREDVPIIIMSGYAEQEILKRFDGSGLTRFLQKPIPGSEIVAAIRDAVV